MVWSLLPVLSLDWTLTFCLSHLPLPPSFLYPLLQLCLVALALSPSVCSRGVLLGFGLTVLGGGCRFTLPRVQASEARGRTYDSAHSHAQAATAPM